MSYFLLYYWIQSKPIPYGFAFSMYLGNGGGGSSFICLLGMMLLPLLAPTPKKFPAILIITSPCQHRTSGEWWVVKGRGGADHAPAETAETTWIKSHLSVVGNCKSRVWHGCVEDNSIRSEVYSHEHLCSAEGKWGYVYLPVILPVKLLHAVLVISKTLLQNS